MRVLRQGLPGLIRMALLRLMGSQLPSTLELHMVGASDDDEARADWALLAKLLENSGVKRLIVTAK